MVETTTFNHFFLSFFPSFFPFQLWSSRPFWASSLMNLLIGGVGGGCIGLRSLFNKNFLLVLRKRKEKKKTYLGARDASQAP